MATHFNSSAYTLKYYHEHVDQSGQTVRLEIHKRTTERLTSKMMCELSSLALSLQGGQDEADAAIVKTNLTFSFVDTYDRNETGREMEKHGNWQEFYTPDSTLYLVVLKTKEQGADSFTTRWSGYITPDSWEEEIGYYGTITVTVRDNLGHLQDFEFDAAGDGMGLISVRNLINAAFDKVSFPMTTFITDQAGGDDNVITQGSVGLFDMLLNVEQFKGQNWYTVLETVLGDLGLVLRYVDNNKVMVDFLRNLTLQGKSQYSSVGKTRLDFTSGTLRLNPPYKEMVDSLTYDVRQTAEYSVRKGVTFKSAITSATYKMRCYGSGSGYVERTGKEALDSIDSNTGEGWSSSGLFMDHQSANRIFSENALMSTNIDVDNTLFAGICLSDSADRYARYNFGKVNSMECVLRLNFLSSMFEMSTFSGKQELSTIGAYLTGLKYRIYYTNPDGTVYSYSRNARRWQSSEVLNEYTTSEQFTSSFEVDLSAAGGKGVLVDGGELVLEIKNITSDNSDANLYINQPGGVYIALTGLELESVGSTVESDKVTTVNNDSYNVKCSKDLKLGAISRPIFWQSVKNYMNVLYKRNQDNTISMAGYNFKWSDSSGETPMSSYPEVTVDGADGTYPLPVLIHLERLLWHGKTTTILEGECLVALGYPFSLDGLFTYKGKTYYLTAGTLNFITGRISGAILVECGNAMP